MTIKYQHSPSIDHTFYSGFQLCVHGHGEKFTICPVSLPAWLCLVPEPFSYPKIPTLRDLC